jgi:septal ring factor EnvC (AmiA/AmiB activator)
MKEAVAAILVDNSDLCAAKRSARKDIREVQYKLTKAKDNERVKLQAKLDNLETHYAELEAKHDYNNATKIFLRHLIG